MSNVIFSLPSEMVEYKHTSKDGRKFIKIPGTLIPLDWTYGTGNTKFKDFAKNNIDGMVYEAGTKNVMLVIELKSNLKIIDPYKQ